MQSKIPSALTIAGSDSGGGAGIEADLKTFAALGVHGMAAITSITAQNTYEVRAIYDLPPKMVAAQIEAVADDIGVDAAKTGMLSNSEIIKAVASTVKKYGFPLVVDPVMIAKSGASLLRPEAVETLVKYIIPLATVVTPNRMEAEKLSGIKIKTIEDAKRAAKHIAEELGAKAVIVKGGHILDIESIDVLYYNGVFKEFRAQRIENGCTHGTGCSFSAAIAAEIAKGKPIEEAVRVAKEFITLAIKYGLKIGKGHCPVNPTAWVEIPAEKYRILENINNALEILVKHGEFVSKLIPETQTNLVMALPKKYSKTINDVAGIPGRIVRYLNTIKPSGSPVFGASKHMAKAVLKAMEFNENIRAVANIKYSKEIIDAAKKLGYKISYYDRREEPPEIKVAEGKTIPWGIEQAIKKLKGEVPDIVYHLGDWGKEPMINIFGKDAVDVAYKIVRIAEELSK
ncbi:MAG: bifunctional hydroxymethylpyrimidine kinase/phosphomethylpyrimidine kinase [Thermoprotei archaeon]|nr:MAG: bifunctional hydroxymethylpyrimidine kinase/phosphomethylpyrimidine kinase [Thermoprotei archaeon]